MKGPRGPRPGGPALQAVAGFRHSENSVVCLITVHAGLFLTSSLLFPVLLLWGMWAVYELRGAIALIFHDLTHILSFDFF